MFWRPVTASRALEHIDASAAHVIVVENGLPNASVSQIVDRLRGAGQAVPLIVATSDLDDGRRHHRGGSSARRRAREALSLTTMLQEIRRLLRAPRIAIEPSV